MNDVPLYERAKQLVEREIGDCVSTLVQGLLGISSKVSDSDFTEAFGDSSFDLMEICETTDFEVPGRQFVENDADMIDLEAIANECDAWDELVKAIVPKLHQTTDEGETLWGYGDEPAIFDNEDDAKYEAFESVRRKLAKAIAEKVTDWESICREYDIEPAYGEVYEHWIVSRWFAEKLKEKGEPVGEFANLYIWGRGTTGQSIYMDSVIQDIAADLWPEDEINLADA